MDKLEETKKEIEEEGGTAYVYSADLADMDSLDELVEQVRSEHPVVDILVNNAGRSIRRSIELSYDRFHDFERTMQLNYFGAIRLTMNLLPHMRERKSGHVIQISSIGAQTNPPRFSAYVASKAALDAWTRVAATETIGDNVHFTTIHMQLVKTPMIAPTKMYDAFPTITPDDAADLICEAIRTQAEDDQHPPRDVRRGALRARAEGHGPGAAHGVQGLPGQRRGVGQEGPVGEGVDGADRHGQPDEGRALVGRALAAAALAAAVVPAASAPGLRVRRDDPVRPPGRARGRRSTSGRSCASTGARRSSRCAWSRAPRSTRRR